MSDQNSDISRRDLLRNIGMSVTLTSAGGGVVTLEAAQHVHKAVSDEKAASPKGPYQPKLFTAQEYKTLQRLADLIIPADEHSKGALEAGGPEFIDFLASTNKDLADIYTGGIAWLDNEMKRRYGAPFLSAKPEEQSAMLDLIAYRKNDSPQLAPGIHFFTWIRSMTVDAFYTSKVGMNDIGFMGNAALSKFSVPEEAIQYALKRSPLG